MFCPMKFNLGAWECEQAECAWWTVYDDIGGTRHERCAIKHLADPTPVTVTVTNMESYKKAEPS